MEPKYVKIYKKIGETPLMAIQAFAGENPYFLGVPMTYAGRLDPIAEGELLVLLGEECKKKDDYLGLSKEYEFEMLFGFKTDSYDLLGISSYFNVDKKEIEEGLEKSLKEKKKKFIQKYPPFSSKTVGGVPLFQKTKDGESYEAPEKEVEIYEIEFISFCEISGKDLLKNIKEKISLVSGDFRQEKIIKKWEDNLKERGEELFLIGKAKMSCSSGTYVRSLVDGLPYPATTFSIKRTKIFGI
jgi:tRNA pseudouridine(55) synthase